MGADAGVDAGGSAPQITAAQAGLLGGVNAVGNVTSSGHAIGGRGGAAQVGATGATASRGLRIGKSLDKNGKRLLKAGVSAVTGIPVGRLKNPFVNADGVPRGEATTPGGGFGGVEQADANISTPEPVSQAPAPVVTPVPQIEAKAKPKGRRSAPLNQAGRRRNRFFAQRGRSSIQVNRPAGAGLSIRRSGVAGAF